MHFNTTTETGHTLKVLQQKSDAQESHILQLFRQNRGRNLTASEVLRMYPGKGILITSIRRALSNLKNWNYLEKTEIKRNGIHGRNECAYRIYTGQQTLF